MSIVATLIDKARQRAGIASDSALAAQFGVHRQAVSKWRNGDAYPDEEHIAEMAIMAGDDPVQWLVAVKAVRADGKAGKAWAALAKRMAAVAMTLVVWVGLASPAHVQAAEKGIQAPTFYTLCEKQVHLPMLRRSPCSGSKYRNTSLNNGTNAKVHPSRIASCSCSLPTRMFPIRSRGPC